jgi:hypothetical protein
MKLVPSETIKIWSLTTGIHDIISHYSPGGNQEEGMRGTQKDEAGMKEGYRVTAGSRRESDIICTLHPHFFFF